MKPVYIIAIVAVAMIGVMVPSSFAEPETDEEAIEEFLASLPTVEEVKDASFPLHLQILQNYGNDQNWLVWQYGPYLHALVWQESLKHVVQNLNNPTLDITPYGHYELELWESRAKAIPVCEAPNYNPDGTRNTECDGFFNSDLYNAHGFEHWWKIQEHVEEGMSFETAFDKENKIAEAIVQRYEEHVEGFLHEHISSDNTSLTIDKIIYHPGELITISGVVEDSQKGTQVKIILTNPDGTTDGLTIYPNDDGEYSTVLQINSEYELGEYSILSSYNSKILGKKIFSIQLKSQNNYDVPIVEPTPEPTPVTPTPEPTPLGIASFVDQSKDPQHYIDRYNNELKYKEWFDENYPQYSSIYEAVGLEEPIVEYVPEPIVEITSTPICATELVNGICPVIQTGVGTYHTVDFMNVFVNNFENNVGCGIVPNPNSNFYMCTGEFWDDDGVKYSLGLRQDLNKEEDIFTHISNVQQPEKISELDATCYSGWFMNSLKRLVCVVDNEFSIKLTVYKYHDPIPMMKQILEKINGPTLIPKIENSKGGGCLIATATYGSEMATEVQQLRELRDNQLLQTSSGTAFISTFNDIYYSFSPTIADMEREHPMFKEAVKLAITPMISSLSLMENAESESEVLSIGISVIMLNLGMYLGVPAIVVIGIKRKF